MSQQLRILHCITDEKFIDSMIDLTQTFWEQCFHEYVLISKQPDIKFLYIHNANAIKRLKNDEIIDHIKQRNINVVVIHNLYSIPYNDLIKIPKSVIVVWFAWGFDIYLPTYNLLRPLIKKNLYYKSTKIYKNSFKQKLYTFISKIINLNKYKFYKKAISRVDYFSGVISEEYELIIADKHNKHFRAKPLHFNYISPESYFSENNIKNTIITGNNIQIGNSADPSNNHIDIIKKLKEFNIGDKIIYCPISYSGNNYYRNKVKTYGEKLFGDSFHPLTTFIPFDEYNKIISTTRYAIFAMERQQAMGNVLVGLWEGRMVFLSENNPAYTSLKNRGYIIYTIQHDLYRIENNESISENDILINRKLLIKDYSNEAERMKAKIIINTLLNHNNSSMANRKHNRADNK